MTNQKCGYGSVFGECGEGRNQVRVAHHIVSEDGGETTQVICSNCLGCYFCSDDNDITTFGLFDFSSCEVHDTPLERLVLEDFDEEEWAKNLARRSKKASQNGIF